jgi:hypothetical protein
MTIVRQEAEYRRSDSGRRHGEEPKPRPPGIQVHHTRSCEGGYCAREACSTGVPKTLVEEGAEGNDATGNVDARDSKYRKPVSSETAQQPQHADRENDIEGAGEHGIAADSTEAAN